MQLETKRALFRPEEDAVKPSEAEKQYAHQRAAMIAQYTLNPKGVRNVWCLREVCLRCGASEAQTLYEKFGPNRRCRRCGETWYVNHCWSCSTGWIDSRDPETPTCSVCGWHKCAACNSCRILGCTTNPYKRGRRHSDATLLAAVDN